MASFLNLKKGLSLIETVIYVSVLVVLLAIVINTTLLLSNSYAGVKVSRDLNNTAVNILERVARETRWSDSINVGESIFDTTESILTLNATADDSSSIVTRFYILNGDLIVEKTGETTSTLDMGGVAVNKFIVKRFDTGISEGVKVELELESSVKGRTKTESFYESIVVRGGYAE